MKKNNILGLPLSSISEQNLIDLIVESLSGDQQLSITYLNPHMVNLSMNDKVVSEFLGEFDVVYCDGIGVKLAARYFGLPRIERFTGPDWCPKLFKELERNPSGKVFLLGDTQLVLDQALSRLDVAYPDLIVVGSHHGFFDKRVGSKDTITLLKKIRKSEASILLIGMGQPLQEQWWIENRVGLPAIKSVICVGALFGHLAGAKYRAPRWFCFIGLEWLGRFLSNPFIYWKRYMIGNVKYIYRVVTYRTKK